MPNFARLQIAFKNLYVRLAAAMFLGVVVGLAVYKADVPQDPSPVVHSQNIAEITQLAVQKDRLDYLLVAKPLSESPRYVFKFKDAPQLHVVKVPSTSHLSLEREVLLKNAIPYSIAKDDYLASHKEVMAEGDSSTTAEVIDFLKRHALDITVLLFIIYAMKFGIPGMGMSASIISPDKLKGSMDDLIGMEDIKQEVLHLEDMIRNRDEYQSHNIDKPFNVMLTGPAGTGKTKLVGYLAKRLNLPLIQASGSALESGYVGGGSKALNALYRKACTKGKCIIFLDEAQSLFMPRGRSEKKWEDDTANTLLGLLDGVKSDKGQGVIWVVASNFDDASTEMDEAMLRRFSVKINFRLPNKAERRALLKSFLSRKKEGLVDWDDLDLDQVLKPWSSVPACSRSRKR
jgi:cell division protease FtsH